MQAHDTAETVGHILRLRRLERQAEAPVRAEIAKVRVFLEASLGSTLTRAQTARLLGITQKALDRWVERGDVPTVLTTDGRPEVPVSEVLSLVEDVARARDARVGRALTRVMRERRRSAQNAIDLNRLLPRRSRPRTHRAPELQALAYHRLIAERLNEDMVEAARERLERLRVEGRMHPRWAAAWRQVLALPLERIRKAIGADSIRARELRQSSPFAGGITAQERQLLRQAVEERLRA